MNAASTLTALVVARDGGTVVAVTLCADRPAAVAVLRDVVDEVAEHFGPEALPDGGTARMSAVQLIDWMRDADSAEVHIEECPITG